MKYLLVALILFSTSLYSKEYRNTNSLDDAKKAILTEVEEIKTIQVRRLGDPRSTW
jgi:hypothetical protein